MSLIYKVDSGPLEPGRWLWPRAIAWGLLLFGWAVLCFVVAVQLGSWIKLAKAPLYLSATLIPAFGVVIYALLVRIAERRRVTELALSRAPLDLIIGGLVGFGFMSATLALLWALGLYNIGWGHWGHWLYYFLFNAYISGVLEELAFRAVVFRIVSRLTNPTIGLLISALAFGLAHAGHAPFMAVVQIIINGGLVLGLLYLVTGRLWMAIGMHIGYDFTEWSLMGVGDDYGLLKIAPKVGASALLTGGDAGPDASMLAGLVGLSIIGCILLFRRHRANQAVRSDTESLSSGAASTSIS